MGSLSDNAVSIFLGNRDGAFQNGGSTGVSTHPIGIVDADLNGDGHPDLVTVNSQGNNLTVVLGNGDGSITSSGNFGAGSAPTGVVATDLNHDGIIDLVVVNSIEVRVFLGMGDGTFQRSVGYPAGGEPTSLAVTDFNGDGNVDLAVGDFSGSQPGLSAVSILLGNGNGTIQATSTFDVQAKPYSMAVADLDDDGSVDVVIADGSANRLLVLLGNGDGTFRSPPDYGFGVGYVPSFIAVSDLNHDAKPDIVVSSEGGTISVLMNSTGSLDVPFSSAFATFVCRLVSYGVTAGCGGGDFCPADPVLRSQMAVFLLRGEHGSTYTPPPCAGIFGDVTCPSPFADWIEQLYNEGITGGCSTNPLSYCPGSTVTRAQMAVFLTVTFSLP